MCWSRWVTAKGFICSSIASKLLISQSISTLCCFFFFFDLLPLLYLSLSLRWEGKPQHRYPILLHMMIHELTYMGASHLYYPLSLWEWVSTVWKTGSGINELIFFFIFFYQNDFLRAYLCGSQWSFFQPSIQNMVLLWMIKVRHQRNGQTSILFPDCIIIMLRNWDTCKVVAASYLPPFPLIDLRGRRPICLISHHQPKPRYIALLSRSDFLTHLGNSIATHDDFSPMNNFFLWISK